MKRKSSDGDGGDEEAKRQHQAEEEVAQIDDWVLPRDTLVAINLMLSQFPKLEQQSSLRPFVLRTQLYSSLSHRTSVDRELEALRQEKVIRVFKLNSGQDDYAIMLLNDYCQQIRAAKKRMESKFEEHFLSVFDWFETSVVHCHTDVSISDSQLVHLLSKSGQVKDRHITVLINAGFLVRQIADSTQYWFSIPNIGSVLKSLNQGRKELLQFLNKRPFKEILLSQLEKRKLRYSCLDVRFHIRDLLGSSQLCTFQTTAGTAIRLVER